MLTQVRISGYKSLQDIDVPMHQLTVVFGANTAGDAFVDDLEGALRSSAL